METKQLGNGNGKLVGNEIHVPHLGEILAFDLPIAERDYFNNAMGAIDRKKLLRPTTAQIFSLIDLAWGNLEEGTCDGIIAKMLEDSIFTSTENLWGKDNVIVYDNPNGKMPSDRKSLIKLHKNGDKRVRVVPYGFKTEIQSVSDFVKNPFVIAHCGGNKDFTEDLVARIAENIGNPGVTDYYHPVHMYTSIGSPFSFDKRVVRQLRLMGNQGDGWSNAYTGVRVVSDSQVARHEEK